MLNRNDLVRRYRAYLNACNRRAWDEIGRSLADSVLVNGAVRSRREYVDDILATSSVFPDYQWELRRVVVEGQWLAVHLRDTGTRQGGSVRADRGGKRVETDEFDMYRFVDGLIVEVAGTADNARLRQ